MLVNERRPCAHCLPLADAERLAERSVMILEKAYDSNDVVLLRPLQILAAARFEQGKTAKARDAFKRIQSIRIHRPEDSALVHGTAAVLLEAEGRRPESEAEYLAALHAWEEAGRGETADAGAILTALGSLYTQEQRLAEAPGVGPRAQHFHTREGRRPDGPHQTSPRPGCAVRAAGRLAQSRTIPPRSALVVRSPALDRSACPSIAHDQLCNSPAQEPSPAGGPLHRSACSSDSDEPHNGCDSRLHRAAPQGQADEEVTNLTQQTREPQQEYCVEHCSNSNGSIRRRLKPRE
jgi:hypothetical protein